MSAALTRPNGSSDPKDGRLPLVPSRVCSAYYPVPRCFVSGTREVDRLCPDYHVNLCPSCVRVMHFQVLFKFNTGFAEIRQPCQPFRYRNFTIILYKLTHFPCISPKHQAHVCDKSEQSKRSRSE